MAKSKKSGKAGRKKKARESTPGKVGDRVTFSESVRINIGDYEHRDIFLSFGTDVEDGETVDAAYSRSKKFVRANLQKAEKKIRTLSQEHVDFDTKAKVM